MRRNDETNRVREGERRRCCSSSSREEEVVAEKGRFHDRCGGRTFFGEVKLGVAVGTRVGHVGHVGYVGRMVVV